MVSEIGSEYWINRNEKYEEISELPYWLKRFGNTYLTSSGRGAISLALDQFEPKVKKALLPSYICESVITPFVKAGYELIFYDLDECFAPININMDNTDIGVFLHMGYYGLPTNRNLECLISKLRSKSVIIIEDITHTMFSNYLGLIENDFIVGSIRKWFGIPSGGFLASNRIIEDKLAVQPKKILESRINGLYNKYEYIQTMNKSLKEDYLRDFRKAEKLLDDDVNYYRIDELSQKIIINIDSNILINRRISNYNFLLEHLKNVNEIDIIFKELNENVCPIFFPIYVKSDRDSLRLYLAKKDIYCPIHWPVPEPIKDHLVIRTKKIYDSILSIPCDQRYGTKDMSKIKDAIIGLTQMKR